MTTHYIEEAERLCDRVAIVDHGQVVALGTPRELKERSGGTTRIEVRLARPEPHDALKNLDGVADAAVRRRYIIHSLARHKRSSPSSNTSKLRATNLSALEIASPSLEDVFIEMTGRRLRD